MSAIALTDHDTFDGIEEATEAGARLGVRVVPGVELSLPHDATFHMIALGVDPGNAEIRRVADVLRDGRGPRNLKIVEKLNALGMAITIDEVMAEAGGDVVARPHFARVLVKKGFVSSFGEAFDRYLTKGGPAYSDRPRVSLPDAAAATRAAGGVTVLCHPQTLGMNDPAVIGPYLAGLRAQGLDAMECRYGSWTRREESFWTGIARDAGLLPSGGSDFHGDNKPDLRIGSGRGRLRVPVEWLDALLDRARSRG